ncbi:MAG: MATE family efflux transporter [Eubacteriales bacterium]|nr:MATE family efflux transporter [Eubacteriales bacterium]MDY4897848.1 MATE family efflux transporter [Eubacteriales bacterium]
MSNSSARAAMPGEEFNRMTEGALWRNILFISLPLILSQILQVLFNMADVAVVGRFSSSEAMGSVGSTSILVTLFTGFLIGMGSGVNVCVARYLGAGNRERVLRTIHTSFVLCLGMGMIICAVCFVLARPLLELIRTKDELIDGAVLYFRIYALGMPALGIFNFGNAVLSANGDTRRPLYYLLAAGILNVILNLLFIIVFKMSADGVALASIISQYLSAVLVLIHMLRQGGACGLYLRYIKPNAAAVREVLALGLPAALQNAIFAIANLFIQTGVNYFDHVVVEGNSAAANSDALVYNVMAAFYTACSSFMGQNMGAGKRDRVLKSYFICLFYSFLAGAMLGGGLVLFGDEFLALFTKDPDVAAAGMLRLRVMGFSYAVSAFMDCTIAASRGIGKGFVPTVIVILGSCVFRVVWVYTVFAHFHTLPALYLLYIFSWSITAVAEIVYFVISYKKLPANGQLLQQ